MAVVRLWIAKRLLSIGNKTKSWTENSIDWLPWRQRAHNVRLLPLILHNITLRNIKNNRERSGYDTHILNYIQEWGTTEDTEEIRSVILPVIEIKYSFCTFM
jgi:hypothetical protein